MQNTWTFKLPPSLGGGDFVLRELDVETVEQVQDAAIMAAGKDERRIMKAGKAMQTELVFKAIVNWKGVDVTAPEAWWHSLRPKERLAVQRAYTKIHTLDEEEEAYLLESVEAAGKKSAEG